MLTAFLCQPHWQSRPTATPYVTGRPVGRGSCQIGRRPGPVGRMLCQLVGLL